MTALVHSALGSVIAACPVCAAGDSGGDDSRFLLLLLLVVPFTVAAITGIVIWRLGASR